MLTTTFRKKYFHINHTKHLIEKDRIKQNIYL